MKKKTFILDVDDVLLHCNDLAVERLNTEKGTHFTLEDISQWGPMGNELDERLPYFLEEEFVRNQTPYPGAIQFIQELRKRGEVYFCTDCPSSVKPARDESLAKWFDAKPEQIMIGSAKYLIHADFMLDDKIDNIMGTTAHKVKVDYPILLRRPWNCSATGLLTVSTYKEALALIDYISGSTPPVKGTKVCSLVGPSGSGKNKVAEILCNKLPMERIKTYTTRKSSDHNHRYLSKELFLQLKEEGFFFETSSYLGEYYGTCLEDVNDVIQRGKHALLVLDINGVIAMKAQYKEQAVSVFVERNKHDAFREIVESTATPDEITTQLVSWDMESSMVDFCDAVIHIDEANWLDKIVKEVF